MLYNLKLDLGCQGELPATHQAADERLHGVEPNRAGQDGDQESQASQRVHLADPWSTVRKPRSIFFLVAINRN